MTRATGESTSNPDVNARPKRHLSRSLRFGACLATCLLGSWLPAAEVIQADVCVYGGTAAGVAAAVQTARLGKRAVIVEFGRHLGGMTSGGLGATDIGNKAAIGGVSREFYHRVALHYRRPDAWRLESPTNYFAQPGGRSTFEELFAPQATMWTFEPHVAEAVLFQMVAEAGVPVYFEQRLARVQKKGARIVEIEMENGNVYRARMFVDATYEGDLMALAGVSYTVGRESNATYAETLNGIRGETPLHQFAVGVDPYRTPGDPSSGLLPFVQDLPAGEPGAADAAVQAYNFRLCYTRNPSNRLPHRQPPGYDPARYELLARYLESLAAEGRPPKLSQFWNPIRMPNAKTDINNNGGFSTDFIGANHAYPESDYAGRARLWQQHQQYTLGFLFFLATSPRVPESLRKEMQGWGPAADEFLDTGGWPRQLYVREARRMVSTCVMTEHHCRGKVVAADSVGLAAYTMDSHNCRRLARNGKAHNEGDVQAGGFPPYPISFRSILPHPRECSNLLVPVCLSATHIAYGSIRMEPVFMILGQSSATAAVLAMRRNCSPHQVPYADLRKRLLADGQILDWKHRTAPPARAPRP